MKRTLTVLAVVVAAAAAGTGWYLHGKQPVRDGQLPLAGLASEVTVRYDERGVPHIKAASEEDMYRAIGYVHAQDRLFQMEILRRLARGELAEVLGAKLVDTDRMFRSLRIRDHADEYVAKQDKNSPAWKALVAYLDGVNQFQDSHSRPLEFDILGIPKRPFTPEDTVSVAGYMAYSFAAAFRTEPVLTYVRDQLGADYLKVFDLDWHPEGVLKPSPLAAADWQDSAPSRGSAMPRLRRPACRSSKAATPGRSRAVEPRAASRCWRVTRTSASPCRRCGTKSRPMRRASSSTVTTRR